MYFNISPMFLDGSGFYSKVSSKLGKPAPWNGVLSQFLLYLILDSVMVVTFL